MMTSVPAALFGLTDRGVLTEGAVADVVVFDPATVGSDDAELIADLPGGSARLTAASRGVRRVLVNGVAVVDNGDLTGATPGVLLRSGVDTETVTAR
jgi:N-acyl-D-aspartate/D-glutamate deacylase